MNILEELLNTHNRKNISTFAPEFARCALQMLRSVQDTSIAGLAIKEGNLVDFSDIKTVPSFENDIIFLKDLRQVKDLSYVKTEYNTIVFCQGGRILVEIGSNSQVNVKPNQLLLIPAGKLIQPIMVSTDVDASVVLISDKMLKSILGNQINIWNKAMYLKEIYVVEKANWMKGFQDYAYNTITTGSQPPLLSQEITFSFLRTLLLMICEDLLRHEDMGAQEDGSSMHDKEIFNRFLQLMSQQQTKRHKVTYYADQLNITSKYLSVISKRVSGKSPMRWITESVMEDSYMLLTKTDLSIKEISNRLGFPNPSFFGHYFREQSGVTPVDYRNKYKKVL